MPTDAFSDPFEPGDAGDLIVLATVLFPHDQLSRRPYEDVVGALMGSARTDPVLLRVLLAGLESIRVSLPSAASGSSIAGAGVSAVESALAQHEGTVFFRSLRDFVRAALYVHPEVRQALGYPGAAFDAGGYLHRGFNDLSWLPDPRIEEPEIPVVELRPPAAAFGSRER